jgi:MoaA/NifB/PqqE/SkfB family radical SAM enzyme
VVVWNVTRRCNLKCVHCYAQAKDQVHFDNELTTAEGGHLDRRPGRQFGSPVMLFSGGEPLVRPDLPELAEYAVSKGHAGRDLHQRHPHHAGHGRTLKDIGLSYVGISLDGMEPVNDHFRG